MKLRKGDCGSHFLQPVQSSKQNLHMGIEFAKKEIKKAINLAGKKGTKKASEKERNLII